MPTYDYVCDACSEKFEKFQSMSSALIKVCPACGKRKVRRLIGAGAGLIFKGSGFYITDYRTENYAKGAKGESDASEKAAGSGKSEGPEGTAKSPEGKSGAKSGEGKGKESHAKSGESRS